MAAVLDVVQKRKAPVEQQRRNRITIRQKRWLLAAHLLFLGAWLGGGLSSLAFNITALSTTDPHLLNVTYTFADLLHTTIIRGGAGGSLITGILLAWLTQWGLARFYWIIAKEIGSLLGVTLDLILIRLNDHAIALTATQGLDAISNPLFISNRTLLLLGSAVQISILLGVIVIAIFKPWGQRKRARQRTPVTASSASVSD
jgi:hypothetical protein